MARISYLLGIFGKTLFRSTSLAAHVSAAPKYLSKSILHIFLSFLTVICRPLTSFYHHNPLFPKCFSFLNSQSVTPSYATALPQLNELPMSLISSSVDFFSLSSAFLSVYPYSCFTWISFKIFN